MKIEYINHSGFTVETENYFLIFDYYKGDIKLKNKKTIVFSTHSHPDHFNPQILTWHENNPDIQYIFSYDIDVEPKKHIYLMKPYETLKLFDINIKSFDSTDLGLSFLVEVEGKTIFFAGDLNWWLWESDSKEEKENMERDFKKEISRIKGNNIDIAFFPVDPRLKENYLLGGKYFIDNLSPKYFIPMHFWNRFDTTEKFANEMEYSPTEVIEIHKDNQIIEI